MADEGGHGDHLQSVPPAVADQIGHPRHGAVVVHHFADHSRRLQAGETRQVDSRLGLSGAFEDASGLGDERKDVARLDDVLGSALGIDGHLDGARPVGRGDAGADAFAGLDRLGEGGLEAGRVLGDHGAEVELVAPPWRQRQTDQAAAVGGHEVDRLGCDELGGHREVALVLAIFVVADHDHAPGADVGEGLLDGGERRRLAAGVGRRALTPRRVGCDRVLGRGCLGVAHANPASDSFSKVRPWADPGRTR